MSQNRIPGFGSNKTRWLSIAFTLLALLIGDNLLERATGISFFNRLLPSPVAMATPTPIPPIALVVTLPPPTNTPVRLVTATPQPTPSQPTPLQPTTVTHWPPPPDPASGGQMRRRVDNTPSVGNLIVCNVSQGRWVRVYRLNGDNQWERMPGSFVSLDPSQRVKIDGLPIDTTRYAKGALYRIELVENNVVLKSTGDPRIGEGEFWIYPGDNEWCP